MPYLLLVLTTLFWSGNFVISRGMHTEIPPFALSFWRWLVALLIFSFFGFPKLWQHRSVVVQNLRFITVQGILGVALFNSLVYMAVQSTTAINAVLVNSCIPVLIAVCSWVMYREILTIRQSLGVCISLCGVALIILHGKLSSLLSLEFNKGDLFVLIAAFVWALYSANLKRYPDGLHPFAYLSGIMVIGLLGIFPFYVGEIYSGEILEFTRNSVITIIYVALFASVLAFIFWNRAVRIIGANKAGPFIHLMPVFSTLLAIIFLGEQVHWFHLAGIFLIFTGIGMTTILIR